MGGTESSRIRRRRSLRLGAFVGAAAALVVATGLARAGLMAAAAGLGWLLWRLPRLERQLFGSQVRPGAPLQPEVWVPSDSRPPAWGAGERAEAHRAYAHALHAVTAAYLAECEREVQR